MTYNTPILTAAAINKKEIVFSNFDYISWVNSCN